MIDNKWCEEIISNNWKEFVNKIEKTYLSNAMYNNFIWRGQGKNESWKLQTTLDRALPKEQINKKCVENHLNNFKYALRGRITSDINLLEEDEVWAIGQHFGLVTPLLDWTFSPFIAAYFAYEYEYSYSEHIEDRVIYAINTKFIEKELSDIGIKIVYPLSNYNKRLINQNGVFLKIPVGVSLEDVIKKKKCSEEKVFFKFIIRESKSFSREEVLTIINSMNINRLTLFPDIDGSASYCNMKLKNIHF